MASAAETSERKAKRAADSESTGHDNAFKKKNGEKILIFDRNDKCRKFENLAVRFRGKGHSSHPGTGWVRNEKVE